ncbi:MAG: hypothetical protein ACI9TH_001837 [Kiritimatiellia bacterium]|jgi:hypothetical protein
MQEPSTNPIDCPLYRTSELTDKILGIAPPVNTFRTIFKVVLGLTIGLLILLPLMLKGQIKPGWLTVLERYALPAGIISGLALGIAEVLRRSLTSMLEIVDRLIDLTERISADWRSIRTGDRTLPAPDELLQLAYTQVFLPCIETALADSFQVLNEAFRIHCEKC